MRDDNYSEKTDESATLLYQSTSNNILADSSDSSSSSSSSSSDISGKKIAAEIYQHEVEEDSLVDEKRGGGTYGALENGDASSFIENTEAAQREEIERLLAAGLAVGRPAWDEQEEEVIRRKLDYRVMIWACVMFFSLQLVRNNITNAISADFLIDAGLAQNEYNLGQTVFLIFFLLWEIPSQALVRRFGADIWLPILMTLWSIMSTLQIFIRGPGLFLFTRAVIGSCEGGFVPGLTFYLSSFYKANELSMRYSWVWSTQSGTNVIGALLASGFIQIGGSLRGWQWLFLLEGILCTCIGISSFFVMPSLRKKVVARVFTPRETAILRVRVAHDDPSKKNQQDTIRFKRESLVDGVKLLYETVTDKYLFPIFILGFVAFVPSQTANYYLTIMLRQLGFTQTATNLLTIPYAIINISMTIWFSRLSDRYGVRWLFAVLSALWVLPNLILIEVIPDFSSRWLRYTFITLILGYPYYHPILISWISANANNPSRRSLGFAVYNIAVQAGNILAANVYREDDAPFYHRGNGVLIALNLLSIIIAVAIWRYFTYENKRRERLWEMLTEVEREEYIAASGELGNQQLHFKLKV
ncbi:major facilitator superfamily domain-containing protein [Myxozyma melibiosi]|uniref:Major facilitator superfamily domain-containing protein n=1 Tax=Myxozyma melibiosi TaxID=54550 RepID=A0ABR1F0C0_9ASCO